MKITINNVAGKFLLALRAGKMETDQIYERFNQHPPIQKLVSEGYIAPDGDGYVITQAGRAVCPSRRETGKPRGIGYGSGSFCQRRQRDRKALSNTL